MYINLNLYIEIKTKINNVYYLKENPKTLYHFFLSLEDIVFKTKLSRQKLY